MFLFHLIYFPISYSYLASIFILLLQKLKVIIFNSHIYTFPHWGYILVTLQVCSSPFYSSKSKGNFPPNSLNKMCQIISLATVCCRKHFWLVVVTAPQLSGWASASVEGTARPMACYSQIPAPPPQALNCLLMMLSPNKYTYYLSPLPPEYIPARLLKDTVELLSEKSHSFLGRVVRIQTIFFFTFIGSTS